MAARVPMVVAIVVVAVPMIVTGIVSVLMRMPGIAGTGANTFDMVVMAFLRRALLRLEAKHLLTILAQLAIHQRFANKNFVDPIRERIEHEFMVVQITGFDKFDPRVAFGDHVRVVIDALHQDAGEQEVRKHDDAPKTKARGVPVNRKYGNTMMRRKPRRAACSRPGSTSGKVTPE